MSYRQPDNLRGREPDKVLCREAVRINTIDSSCFYEVNLSTRLHFKEEGPSNYMHETQETTTCDICHQHSASIASYQWLAGGFEHKQKGMVTLFSLNACDECLEKIRKTRFMISVGFLVYGISMVILVAATVLHHQMTGWLTASIGIVTVLGALYAISRYRRKVFNLTNEQAVRETTGSLAVRKATALGHQNVV
jgi:positive regulator of sigma E activity